MENEPVDMMKRIVLPLFCIMTGMLGCTLLSMGDIPSEDIIRKWGDNKPVIIEPIKITGVYRNMDIDAVVFKYTTSVNKENFWTSLQSRLQETKWQLISEPSDFRTYERRFSKGAKSPGSPDMAIFSSAELLKVEYRSDKRKIGNTCPQGYHLGGSSGYCVSN